MQFKKRAKKEATIEIASLVDVVFLLLLFFVVTTTFRETPGMDIDLPETRDSKGVQVKDLVVNVYATADGTAIMFGDNRISPEQLEERLRREIASRPEDERAVVVQADKNVRFEMVYRVFDIARAAGATGITVPAEFKPQEGQ